MATAEMPGLLPLCACDFNQSMQHDVPSINVSETLENVMERMQIKDRGLLIATENGHVAGIIDIDNIMELLRFQKALQEYRNA